MKRRESVSALSTYLLPQGRLSSLPLNELILSDLGRSYELMFIVAVAKCLTEAAEEFILFMVLEDSAHHGGQGAGEWGRA